MEYDSINVSRNLAPFVGSQIRTYGNTATIPST